jgi:hypothetical protein
MGSPISGPIAYLNNVPINPQWYSPRQQFISNITLGLTTTVTMTTNTQFVIGQTCRLLIPPQFGCRQLNQAQGNVIAVPNPNQVVLNINSINSNAFISSSGKTQPQIISIGDVNQGSINSSGISQTGTFIPGSFIDISPD